MHERLEFQPPVEEEDSQEKELKELQDAYYLIASQIPDVSLPPQEECTKTAFIQSAEETLDHNLTPETKGYFYIYGFVRLKEYLWMIDAMGMTTDEIVSSVLEGVQSAIETWDTMPSEVGEEDDTPVTSERPTYPSQTANFAIKAKIRETVQLIHEFDTREDTEAYIDLQHNLATGVLDRADLTPQQEQLLNFASPQKVDTAKITDESIDNENIYLHEQQELFDKAFENKDWKETSRLAMQLYYGMPGLNIPLEELQQRYVGELSQENHVLLIGSQENNLGHPIEDKERYRQLQDIILHLTPERYSQLQEFTLKELKQMFDSDTIQPLDDIQRILLLYGSGFPGATMDNMASISRLIGISPQAVRNYKDRFEKTLTKRFASQVVMEDEETQEEETVGDSADYTTIQLNLKPAQYEKITTAERTPGNPIIDKPRVQKDIGEMQIPGIDIPIEEPPNTEAQRLYELLDTPKLPVELEQLFLNPSSIQERIQASEAQGFTYLTRMYRIIEAYGQQIQSLEAQQMDQIALLLHAFDTYPHQGKRGDKAEHTAMMGQLGRMPHSKILETIRTVLKSKNSTFTQSIRQVMQEINDLYQQQRVSEEEYTACNEIFMTSSSFYSYLTETLYNYFKKQERINPQ